MSPEIEMWIEYKIKQFDFVRIIYYLHTNNTRDFFADDLVITQEVYIIMEIFFNFFKINSII